MSRARVNQPSTKIWKKNMMARLIQNEPVRTSRLRSTARSTTTARAMATTVMAV